MVGLGAVQQGPDAAWAGAGRRDRLRTLEHDGWRKMPGIRLDGRICGLGFWHTSGQGRLGVPGWLATKIFRPQRREELKVRTQRSTSKSSRCRASWIPSLIHPFRMKRRASRRLITTSGNCTCSFRSQKRVRLLSSEGWRREQGAASSLSPPFEVFAVITFSSIRVIIE